MKKVVLLTIMILTSIAGDAFAGRQILKGSTDQSVRIRIIDSTAFTPETGVDYDTSGIDLWYHRQGATKTNLTEAALASLDAAHSDGGIEHIGDGYYRLDIPDAAFATGADSVMIGGAVSGMIVIGYEVELVGYDPSDGVRLGLASLPNVAAGSAGGLADDTDANGRVRIVDGTGAGEIDTASGLVSLHGDYDAAKTAAQASAQWSTGEREQIRDALGVDGDKTTATSGDLQAIEDIVASATYGNEALKTLLDAKPDTVDLTESTELVGDIWAAEDRYLTDGSVIWQHIVDTGDFTITAQEAVRLLIAFLVGESSGAGTSTVIFQRAVDPDTTAITYTVDAVGNRSAVVYDVGDIGL